MAFRKRFGRRRRFFRRRTFGRARRFSFRRRLFRKGTYKAGVQRAIAFSRSQVVKLRYSQQVSLNPTTANAYIIYRANSINDPAATRSASVGGTPDHRPLGYNQWAAVYNHYIVLGSKIRVKASSGNSSNPTTAGGIISILLSDQATPNTNPTTVFEQGRTSYKQMASNSNDGSISVMKTFSPKKFFNISKLKDNVDLLGAPMASDPTEEAYYHLQFFANDQSTTGTVGPLCWVDIDYICLLTGPIDIPQSALG